MKAEDFLDDNFIAEYYQGEVFGDFAYPRATVIEAMGKYAEEILKIAAEKAKIKRNYYPKDEGLDSQISRREHHIYEYTYFIDKESVLNCLKE